jgi:hypothetical protein
VALSAETGVQQTTLSRWLRDARRLAPMSDDARRIATRSSAIGAAGRSATAPPSPRHGAHRRVLSWLDGEWLGFGVTEAKAAEPAVKAVEAWHETYGTLLVQVHAEYDDDKDESHALLRDRLLSPYEDAAEEERRADQRARAASARKKIEAEPEPIG